MLALFKGNEFVTFVLNKDPSKKQIESVINAHGLNVSECSVEEYLIAVSPNDKIIFDEQKKMHFVTIDEEEVKVREDKDKNAIMENKKVLRVAHTKESSGDKFDELKKKGNKK